MCTYAPLTPEGFWERILLLPFPYPYPYTHRMETPSFHHPILWPVHSSGTPSQVRSRSLGPMQNTDRPASSQHLCSSIARPASRKTHTCPFFGCNGKIHPCSRKMGHLFSSLQWFSRYSWMPGDHKHSWRGLRVRHRVPQGSLQRLRSPGLWDNVLIQ